MTINQDGPRLGRTSFSRSDWAWQDSANCRGEDLNLFFGTEFERGPEKDAREREAKLVCMACPVTRECLDAALRSAQQHGVWAGMTAAERAAKRRSILRRKQTAA